MILTTTNSIEGFKIMEYKGIVSGVGMTSQKGSITFSMSKYYKEVSESISTVKEQAFQALRDHAKNLKANAVVGIKVDIELTTTNYVMASITGTAVFVA